MKCLQLLTCSSTLTLRVGKLRLLKNQERAEMIEQNWTEMLVEPKAILAPYQLLPPSLASFAPHFVRMNFDDFSVEGQFLELPKAPPEKWRYGDRFRAYAVFQFGETRVAQMNGFLKRTFIDDALHGVPEGEAGDCKLELELGSGELRRRKFVMRTSTFYLELDAAFVQLYLGRKAHGQHGWPNATHNRYIHS
jgi:hypothetical protein